MSYDFDLLKAEWMKENLLPLYNQSQMEIKTQPDQELPVGECHCEECDSVPLSSPLTTTQKMTTVDSPWPLQICGTVSSNGKLLPLLEPGTCKGMDMATVLDPPQPGKRSLEEELTLSVPEEPPSNVVTTVPKKKRAKKVPTSASGELSQGKVIFHPKFGTLCMNECIGIVPGRLMTYKCVDRDFNTILIERFKFEGFDEEVDIDILPPDM